jgi:hypothetical protein
MAIALHEELRLKMRINVIPAISQKGVPGGSPNTRKYWRGNA